MPSDQATATGDIEHRDRVDDAAETVCTTPVSDARRGSLGVNSNVLRSVVKIFAVRTEPNLSMPWQMKRQFSTTASGFVISGRRIITNAHAVAFQTSVRVRKHGCAEKFVAKMLGVCHQCDLAMITVEEESFWNDLEALEFGGVPHLQESITVIGYPTGGDSISVTKGVVSRVEETYYSHGNFRLLAIQIDAAINPGNSGGPALLDTKVVGVCFETLLNAENIGYIIPVPVIQHFLEDIERNKGKCSGFCDIGLQIQLMESDCIRASLGMTAQQTGVLVNRVFPLADAANHVKKDDVLLEIDDTVVGNDGTIQFRDGGERVSFRYTLLSKFDGDTVKLKLLREGNVIETTVKVLLPELATAVPANQYDIVPSYFIYAGLVFQVLTQPYLHQEWTKDWQQKAPVRFVEKALYAAKDFADQETIILSQVLAADINVTYGQYVPNVLTHFNRVPVRNLKHLVELVESNTSPYLRFDLESERVIIINSKDAATHSERILESHSIPSAKSLELRKQAQGKLQEKCHAEPTPSAAPMPMAPRPTA